MIGRRQFVGTTAFVFVGLGPAAAIGKEALQSQSSDPVLDAMIADLAELTREGNASPSARKGVLRAAEALTGAMAVHLGQHYDGQLKSSIRRLGRNRQAFVQDITTKLNKPEVTHEKVEAALKALEKDGFKGALLGSRQVFKRVRENAPEVMQVKRVQFDYCQEAQWYITMMEMLAAIACGLAFAFAGTNLAADLACASATAQVILLQAAWLWFCR